MSIMKCGVGEFEFEVIRFKSGYDKDEVLDFMEGSNPIIVGDNGPLNYFDGEYERMIQLFPMMTKTWLIKDSEGRIFYTDKHLFSKLQELASTIDRQ